MMSFNGRVVLSYGACGQSLQAQASVDPTTIRLTDVVIAGGFAPARGQSCGDGEAIQLWNTDDIIHWKVDGSRLVADNGSMTATFKATD